MLTPCRLRNFSVDTAEFLPEPVKFTPNGINLAKEAARDTYRLLTLLKSGVLASFFDAESNIERSDAHQHTTSKGI
jgi:hypothetical protein